MALPAKLRFDTEDHPPESYYEPDSTPPPSRLPFQTPNPETWVQAPEFVPRARQKLQQTFCSESPPPFSPMDEFQRSSAPIQEQPFYPHGHMFADTSPISRTTVSVGGPPLPPLLPPFPLPMVPPFPAFGHGGPPPFHFVPSGYSANVANLNPGIGPPIPAIVLKKKRRRRNKDKTQSMLLEGDSSCSPPAPSDPREFAHEMTGDRTTIDEEDNNLDEARPHGGSCPDLSSEQLEMWDDFLYESVVKGRSRASAERQIVSNMQSAGVVNPAYEVMPRAALNIMEESLTGVKNPELRRLNNEINGNIMTASMVLQSLKVCSLSTANLAQDKFSRTVDAPGSTVKSLAAELDELSFRPEISKYGYPQFDADRHHIASFHPDGVISTLDSIKLHPPMVEDSFEGMRIRVNAFEDSEDLELSESECPEPSRFQRLQWALQQRKSAQNGPPDRVCCSMM